MVCYPFAEYGERVRGITHKRDDLIYHKIGKILHYEHALKMWLVAFDIDNRICEIYCYSNEIEKY